jgi:Flp pilus assembly protein TadD
MSLKAEQIKEIVNQARAAFPIFDIQESKVEEIGNYLMLIKQKRQAIEVFRLNASLYPNSAKAYFKLGAAYEAVGEKTLAAENFKKAVELDPNNKEASERLKKFN